MTLQEAAQAVEAAHHPTDHADAVRVLVALALASPSPDRWTEGAEARAQKIEEAVTDLVDRRNLLDGSLTVPWYHVQPVVNALALPVPPATTAPETKPAESEVGWCAWEFWRDTLGRSVTVQRRPGLLASTRVRITVEPAPVEPEETP